MDGMLSTEWELSRLRTNPANPRQITEHRFRQLVTSILAFPKMLEKRPVVAEPDGTVLGGNMRLRALVAISQMTPEEIRSRLEGSRDFQRLTAAERDVRLADWEAWLSRPVVGVVSSGDLSEDEKRQFIIKDNVGYGDWDMDALANEWDASELNEWGVDVWDSDAAQGDAAGDPEPYSRKVVAPTYEPNGNTPEFSQMYDTSKRDELISEIDAALRDGAVDDELAEFLRAAAARHTVFNYGKIADYYANAPKQVQELMERSALVIIDFDKAIENGFVTMTKDLANAYRSERGITDEPELTEADITDTDEYDD